MNVLSRKLHELEDNILDFPPEDDDIMLHVGDLDEQLLHDRAQKIRAPLKDDVQAIIDSGTSAEQQNEAAIKCPMGSARNIILRLKSLRLIRLWCRDRLSFYILESADSSVIKKPMTLSRIGANGLRKIEISLVGLLESCLKKSFAESMMFT
jgi:hypothetical protein